MFNSVMKHLIKIIAIILIGGGVIAQNLISDKIYLIELDTKYDVPYDFYLSCAFDYKKYEADVSFFPIDYEIGITSIEDFTECFQPDIKIITSNHTFLICTTTGEGLMFPNKAPYLVQEKAEPVKIKLDENTQELIAELEYLLIDYQKFVHYQCSFPLSEEDLISTIEAGLNFSDLISLSQYLDPDIQEMFEEELNELISTDNDIIEDAIILNYE